MDLYISVALGIAVKILLFFTKDWNKKPAPDFFYRGNAQTLTFVGLQFVRIHFFRGVAGNFDVKIGKNKSHQRTK